MKDTQNVAIPLIQDSSGKFLLITRSEYPEHKNEWGPIAGHVRENESIEDALIRESREELSVNIKPIKHVTTLPQDIGQDIGHWWTCEIVSGEIKPNHEVEKYQYFTIEEIKGLKLWPATKKFFDYYYSELDPSTLTK